MTSVTAGTSFQAMLRGEDGVHLFIVWSHASSLQLSLGHLGSFLNVSSRIGQYLHHRLPSVTRSLYSMLLKKSALMVTSRPLDFQCSTDNFVVAEQADILPDANKTRVLSCSEARARGPTQCAGGKFWHSAAS